MPKINSCLCIIVLLQEPTDIPSRKKNEVGVCQRLVCQEREFTVRSSYCEVDPKLKNEIFVRIDMKHSYFRTICLQSIFSVVKIVVVSKN